MRNEEAEEESSQHRGHGVLKEITEPAPCFLCDLKRFALCALCSVLSGRGAQRSLVLAIDRRHRRESTLVKKHLTGYFAPCYCPYRIGPGGFPAWR